MILRFASGRRPVPETATESADGSRYEHYRDVARRWSVHVVRAPRRPARFAVVSRHADGRAVGLKPVTAQLPASGSALIPVAAINGDYYQREGPYAGDPRGLQIVDGELISAPDGGVSLWVDATGEPHLGIVESKVRIVWPDGSATPCGLNGSRPPDRLVIYTPAVGASTRTREGREFILEPAGPGVGEALAAGRTYRARIIEVTEGGNARIPPGRIVLSIGTQAAQTIPTVGPGTELDLSTATEPDLPGVRTAISGGPWLVQNGRRVRIDVPDSDAYIFSSMKEPHPRSAIGWNDEFLFLVAVDGRQMGIAEGMTLDELAAYLVRLGCREAMNLDGGGSSTLWYAGAAVNHLCDGYERDVANSLIVVRPSEAIPGRTGPVSGATGIEE